MCIFAKVGLFRPLLRRGLRGSPLRGTGSAAGAEDCHRPNPSAVPPERAGFNSRLFAKSGSGGLYWGAGGEAMDAHKTGGLIAQARNKTDIAGSVILRSALAEIAGRKVPRHFAPDALYCVIHRLGGPVHTLRDLPIGVTAEIELQDLRLKAG